MKELEIVTKITTPMALAALALCLLLGTGLLKAIARVKRPSAALKMLIHWGFVLALILGVLANISYLVTASFAREARLAGTVRDEAGKPVPLAVVDLGGKKGRAITDDYGEFEMNIPDSRTSAKYTMAISCEGFASTNVTIAGPRPKDQVEITLARPVYLANDFAKISATGVARHYLGVPQLELTVDFANPYPRKITLENVSLLLTDPSQKAISLSLEGTFVAPGTPMIPAVVPFVSLEKAQVWTLGCSFFNRDPGMLEQLGKAQLEVPFIKKPPAVGDRLYSDGLVKEFCAFMTNRLIWKAGNWKGQLGWSVAGKFYERTFQFTLSNEDISRMSAITNYYAAGFGILGDWRFARVGEANPAAALTLSKWERPVANNGNESNRDH